jgi:nicotinamidase-related amidase
VSVVKRRTSAFSGSDLDVLLRAAHVERLILAGLTTSGVVLSTMREAADRDYRITVLSDACHDPDENVQRVLLDKIIPHQALQDWTQTLDAQ